VNLSAIQVGAKDADAPWLLQFQSLDTVATVKWNGLLLGEARWVGGSVGG
jgi:hypothetical protein